MGRTTGVNSDTFLLYMLLWLSIPCDLSELGMLRWLVACLYTVFVRNTERVEVRGESPTLHTQRRMSSSLLCANDMSLAATRRAHTNRHNNSDVQAVCVHRWARLNYSCTSSDNFHPVSTSAFGATSFEHNHSRVGERTHQLSLAATLTRSKAVLRDAPPNLLSSRTAAAKGPFYILNLTNRTRCLGQRQLVEGPNHVPPTSKQRGTILLRRICEIT